MRIGTSIIVLAAWLPVVAEIIKPNESFDPDDVMPTFVNAWILTALAIGLELVFRMN